MIHEALKAVFESDDYLDISIKNVDKVVSDEKSASQLINQDVVIYGKYDGTKLSLLRTDADWDETQWWKMFIVSYKGNIIYGTEYSDVEGDLNKTVGVSQYKAVIDHVADNFKTWKSVPKNTEFFVEFLMNKPTLTRQYTKLRQLILIGHGKVSSVNINNGRISIKSSGLNMSDREKWAKILGLNLPELIFSGKLIDMPKGLNSRAKEYFKDFESSFKGLPADGYWELAKNFFMQLPSLYGSIKEEGVVIHLTTAMGGTNIIKIVQDDQYDKELRFKIKQQYKMEVKDEDEYWVNVRGMATHIIERINLKQKFAKILQELSNEVYKDSTPNFTHKKKTELNIRDDIQLTAKSMIMRMLPGNNGALVVGKFRVFTNGHKKMFDQALKNRDYLVVALVSNKETKATLELRKEMIQAVYPKVEIIMTTSGNLLTMINKTSQNINAVLAGSDRVKSYQEQLKRNLDVQVEEVRRGEDDESATKVIRNLKDQKYFKSNVPKQIHKMYDELLKTYTQGESFRKQGDKMLREIVEGMGNKAISPYELLDGSKTDGDVLVIGETPDGDGISLTNSNDGLAVEWGEGQYKFIDNPKDVSKAVKKHTGIKLDTTDSKYKKFISKVSIGESKKSQLMTLGIARALGKGDARVKDAKSGLVYKITKEEKDGLYTAIDPEGKSVKLNLGNGQWSMVGRAGIENSPRKRG